MATSTIPPGAQLVYPAATLDDQGRALVVWTDGSVGLDRHYWQSADASARWSAMASVPFARASLPPVALRANGAGSAVLGRFGALGPQQVLLRYEPATGWDPAPLEVPMSEEMVNFAPETSDIAIRADGSIVLSSRGPATTPGPTGTHAFRVLRHERIAGWRTLLETRPFFDGGFVGHHAYLVADPSGAAAFFWRDFRVLAPGTWEYDLSMQAFDVSSGMAFGPLPLSQNQHHPCPMTAAASSTRFRVLAVMNGDESVAECHLETVIADMSRGVSTTQRLTSVGSTLTNFPVVAVSPQGDSVVVWQEFPRPAGTGRLLWSQSLAGGSWSAPLPVIAAGADVGTPTISDFFHLLFATNAQGSMIGAAQTLKGGREYLAVGRFTPATGWSWQLVANMTDLVAASVGLAMNSAGAGLLVYRATPCERLPLTGDGVSTRNCGAPQTYALKF